MRILIAASSVAIWSQSLIAEPTFKFTGQVRLDHKTTQNTTGDVTKNSSGFSLNRGRLVFEGALDKEISYRIKMYFDRSQYQDVGTTASNDGVSKGLVEAKLMHRWCENFSLELGRLEVNSMSVEGFYSSMDTYSVSQVLINRKPGSANGVAFVNRFWDQTLTLQVVNSPGYDVSGNGDYKVENDDMTLTAYWQGNLADGMIKPIVSFANISRRDYDAKTKVISEKYDSQIVGIGSSFIVSSLTAELEMDAYSNPKYRKNIAFDFQTGKSSAMTMVAALRYKITPMNLTALLRYSNDNEMFTDDASKDKIITNKYGVGAEWRPNGNTFRYHAFYDKAKAVTLKDGKDDVPTDINTYLVGAAASI